MPRAMEIDAELLGQSPALAAVREQVKGLLQRVASGRLPAILIEGETGTGKGLLARMLHRGGPRAGRPFVDVNCAAIPESLLESELFGHEKGAFTDARQAKAGLFQAAHGGTLFLDEVGLLPVALQGKLLKAVEERTVRRLGGTRSEPIDVWMIAATSEDLRAALRGGRMREDLYHRLAVVSLRLPPLRERGEDVVVLAEHFLARACAEYGRPAKTLAPEARAALRHQAWPGNVRELSNVMERVALLTDGRARDGRDARSFRNHRRGDGRARRAASVEGRGLGAWSAGGSSRRSRRRRATSRAPPRFWESRATRCAIAFNVTSCGRKVRRSPPPASAPRPRSRPRPRRRRSPACAGSGGTSRSSAPP